MYSLNFDIDTTTRVIKMLKFLKLWSDKLDVPEIEEMYLGVGYDDDCYIDLLIELFSKSITDYNLIHLNEENSNISDEVYYANADYFSIMLNYFLSECTTDKCDGCSTKYVLDCAECREFCDFLHFYDFKKIKIKSTLFRNCQDIDNHIIFALGQLYAYSEGIDQSSYVGCNFNKDELELEILFFTFVEHPEGLVELDYSFNELVDIFKQILETL